MQPIPITVCSLYVCCVADCGKTVQGRLMVCIEVEYECGFDILIGTILTLNPQTGGVKFDLEWVYFRSGITVKWWQRDSKIWY